MKKRFVAPILWAEATLELLTQGICVSGQHEDACFG